MKAASLGHQYLNAHAINDSDTYFNLGRIRGTRRQNRKALKSGDPDERTNRIFPASEPLSRRTIGTNEGSDGNESSSANFSRCLSESQDMYVVYEQPTQTVRFEPVSGDHKPYSLKSMLTKKHGNPENDDNLSSRVRRFYKKQDELIDSFQKLHEDTTDTSNRKADSLDKQRRYTDLMIRITLVFNVSLLIAKIVAAVFSRSLSIISSVVDSAVDSASACLLFWVVRVVKRRDPYTYPGGRTRLEPIVIVILSVVMVSASVQVIYESVESLINDVNHFTKNSTELRQIDMGPAPISVMAVTIVCKAVLSFFCYRMKNPTLHAMAQDHRNDVFSNIVALVCGILAAKALNGSIKAKELVVIDPVGAILISLYIIFCWLKQLREQVRNLSGYAAEPEFIQKITWLTLHHSPLIQKIDTVRAFHFGTSFLVEVEVILPESMSLKEAHDIGDALEDKLECIPEVEKAFVHLDYVVEALEY